MQPAGELSRRPRGGFRSWHLLAGILLTAGSVNAVTPTAPPPGYLRTLTTAHDAHNLPLTEAARAYPVSLRAVVTYYDPYIDPRRPALFVHDSTGAIFVAVSSLPKNPIRSGMLIEVVGVTATGDFAPIVDRASIRVIGESHIPAEAPRVSLTQLLTGAYDGQWVEVKGVVHSVREFGRNVNLVIAMGDGPITATTLSEQGVDYLRLVDATVGMHANAAPTWNRKHQMTGVRLLFPGIKEVRIEEAAFADPFSLPTLAVDHLLNFTPNLAFPHRIHVRGRVSLQWPGRSLCLQDATNGICVQTAGTTRLAAGEMADVVGFEAISGLSPTLTDATFRSAGGRRPVVALPVTAEQALSGDFDGRLVNISGKLIGKDRAAGDPTMVLSSGRFLFGAVLPQHLSGRGIPDWKEGSILRISGICSVQVAANEIIREGFSTPASAQILLRSADDVVVERGPSWWTAAHLVPVLAVILAISLCVLGWVALLRQRIGEQAAVIGKQNATLRDLSFRDGLTGIANRRKFDETLEIEFERASRSSAKLSLLIVDIDYFKALNDQYGHQRGDECLVRVANALASVSLRPMDLVARYGGEEFAVILPGCEEEGAIALADRMRTAVFDLSITHAGSPHSQRLSISVGVATTFAPDFDAVPASLVRMADGALYHSKAQGRNQTTSFRKDRTNTPNMSLVNA